MKKIIIFVLSYIFLHLNHGAQAQYFLEKTFSIPFANNANNQVAYINIPKELPIFGTIEIQLTGGFNNEINRGVLIKNIDIVYVANGYLNQQSVVSEAREPLANQWYIGDFNSTTSQIPIYHLTSSANELSVKVKMHLLHTGTISAFQTGLSIIPATTQSNGAVRSYKYFNDNRIGIGTSSPEHRLDIVGTLRAHEILVNTQKTADFVFEPDYDLESLDMVKNYVTKNKHLPGIPSARDMEKDGINVGQFQIDLLQKIEELTLHLIDKNDEIKALRVEIQGLKSDVQELKVKK